MLQSLHVKNLALMEETEIQFGEGLNILTGETGAGKSLLIGSINLALGGKFEKDMLRTGAESALVELTFSGDDKVMEKLREMDIDADMQEGVIISRKMQIGKSVCKINGETVTAKQLKELSEVLIDIHGQHEHQSLLHKRKHMEILDAFCGEAYAQPAETVYSLYHKCKNLRDEIAQEKRDEQELTRERSLAEFECQEILNAKLIPDEDEELEQRYRFMVNSKKIRDALDESYSYSGNDEGAGSALSRALRALRNVVTYDDKLQELEQQLNEIDNLLSDYNHDIAAYMQDCNFKEDEFAQTEERLNLINHLKGKYGATIQEILQYAEAQQKQLEKLSDYDAYMVGLERQLKEAESELNNACEALSKVRREQAVCLTDKLQEALRSLNFLTVDFEVAVRPNMAVTELGYDDVEFLISTNPGEARKALGQVASGGELSRVMLAIKTVLAGRDAIDTLIFDEIDAGISGKTAWKVSEQLHQVARAHQVICITHLPQIAAMADTHFVIEKNSTDNRTITDVRSISEKESMSELARLLGSDSLTESALQNAKEMRSQALTYKNS